MRIITLGALAHCWVKHPESRKPLEIWYNIAKKAKWKNINEIKMVFSNVSVLANNRIVFNIKGNDYRLVVVVKYTMQAIYIRWVGTHAEYDKIDANTI
jgi:mRNA interferase HigB